ncbi:MAG TPA: zinc ribbon domain-containing protein [Deltaproteobacteria bacterium]|jgi:putative FmdB family regulatory protein|nr:zinc ribbon domain-containing protein [Deltaproteobacteria bacterium]HOI07403.1 zinc ribbon domain-containing protein [Deltaproteobacteria bacterium]
MPIYEFYCHKCNTVYNFFSRSVNTEKIPLCPTCKDVPLKRKVSLFAAITGKGRDEADEEGGMPPIDESKMERAMAMLASEAGKMNDDDPRQAARLMRKLSEATGLRMGAGMEEALSRMERGEDPDRIEAEMGDLLEGEEPFVMEERSSAGRKEKPSVDTTLYEL